LKKTFKLLGLLIVLLVSFIYTNNVFNIVKKKDRIMKEVINYKSIHEIKPIEPIINKDEVTIGSSGISVNEELSYKKMKKENRFNENNIVYKSIKPTKKISDLLDYYISRGSTKNNSVSIIFKVKSDYNLNELLNLLDEYNLNITFFIDGYYVENNLSMILDINKQKHEIYNLGYINKYDNNISRINKLLESITLNKSVYCLNEKKNEKYKNICKRKKMYSIFPTITNPNLEELKKVMLKGTIISYDLEEFDISKFDTIYKIIYSRGLKVDYLKNILNEN